MKYEHGISLSFLMESNDEIPNPLEVKEKLLKILDTLNSDQLGDVFEVFESTQIEDEE